jgi:tRNA nucleotidyltransferase (CCA-adding enzyme)
MNEIKIEQKTQEIFDTLKAVAKEYEYRIRVAGGWVRDLIMGNESNDLDIAVEGATGLTFANRVVEYLGSGKVHIIKADADKSKHLETAVLSINGQEVQFSGFRKETYADTRIPNVEVGTIQDDAFRRDLTINSLYYNINTGKIEDITGKGLHDIQHKIIRTPLPPRQTFLDDPLRVIRSIRFATRFDFTIDPDLLMAVKDPDVQHAFRNKVSRERIEIEMRKIITGNDPVKAIRLLSDLGLLYAVFQFPEGYLDWAMDQKTPHHELNVFDHTLEALGNLQKVINKYTPDIPSDDKLVLNYALLFHDTGKLNPKCHGMKSKSGEVRRTYYNHERYSLEATEHILKHLAGTKIKEIERVKRLIEGSSRINPNYTPTNEKCGLSRKALCRLIRLVGTDWKLCILLNIADTSAKKKNYFDNMSYDYYEDMLNKILEIDPEKVIHMKPMLSGYDVINMTGAKDAQIGMILDRLLELQYSNPKLTRAEAEKYVKSFRKNIVGS